MGTKAEVDHWYYPEGALLLGDCLERMKTMEAGLVDLVFADPPYNIGYAYDVYNDNQPPKKYMDWVNRWVKESYRIIRPGGAFWVMCHSSYFANFELELELSGFIIRNRIIWHYTFGRCQKTKFTLSWVPLFYAVKPGEEPPTFNASSVSIPSDRQLKYNDSRANPNGKVPNDVWTDIPRLCGTFKERNGHPCQLPERLLERIIKATSNKGDLMLDPFCGSGTSIAVAKALGRKFVGIELSPAYAKLIRQRLKTTAVKSGFGV